MSICNGCETVRKIQELIDKFDKLEDNNHEAANTSNSTHVKDVFSSVGTVYGICAEELRILVREI